MPEQRHRPLFAAILALALALRLWGITSRPIWYDEAFSMLFAAKGFQAMLYGTLAPTSAGSADIHPLGYYTLLGLWLKLLGGSLVSARILSIAAGLASVYLVHMISREATESPETARLAMLIAALAPFQIHYAQEIRMYSFLALWLLLATFAFQRAAKTGGWKWWALFAASAASAQYTHNLAAFYLVALAATPLFHRNWRALRGVLAGGLGSVILYLPWLIHLPAQLAKVRSAYWVERPDFSKIFTLLIVYTSHTPLPPTLIGPALLVALLVVSLGIIQTARRSREPGARAGLWLLYLAFGPPALLFVVSQWRPVYIERALLPSGAMFCAWLAWALLDAGLAPVLRRAAVGLLLFSFSLGIYQHLTYRDFPYGPYEALAGSLRARALPGDAIVHANKLTYLPMLFFDPRLSQKYVGDPAGSRTDTLAPATQEVLGIEASRDIGAAMDGSQRIWFIIHQRALDEYMAANAMHPQIENLNSRYQLETQENWEGLRLFLYGPHR